MFNGGRLLRRNRLERYLLPVFRYAVLPHLGHYLSQLTLYRDHMTESRTHLTLRIEPFVLRSAVQAYLESDARLRALGVVFDDVAGAPAGGSPRDPVRWPPLMRNVDVELKEPMLSFELSVDGRRRGFAYQGMAHLVDQIAAACA